MFGGRVVVFESWEAALACQLVGSICSGVEHDREPLCDQWTTTGMLAEVAELNGCSLDIDVVVVF